MSTTTTTGKDTWVRELRAPTGELLSRSEGAKTNFYRLEIKPDHPEQGDFATPLPYAAEYVQSEGGYYKRRKVDKDNGRITTEWGPWGTFASPSFFRGVAGVSTSDVEHSKSRALDAFRSSAVDFGVSLGEAPETVRELAALARRVALGIKSAKRGDWRNTAKHLALPDRARKHTSKADMALDVLTGNYLGYLFGISPLIDDLYNAASSVQSAMSRNQNGSAKGVVIHKVMKAPNNACTDVEVRVGVETGFRYKIQDSHLALLSALGLTNPANIVWNLARLSFVVDWFVPIGDYLRHLSDGHGTAALGGYSTKFKKCSGVAYLSPEKIQDEESYGWEWLIEPKWSFDCTLVSRSVFEGFPTPSLHVRKPYNAAGKLVTTIALIDQLRR